jgi:hypothetical protein
MRRFVRPLAAACAGLFTLAAVAPLAAQDETPPMAPPPPREPAPAAPMPITSLDKALDLLEWDPARRGALLAVDAANTRAPQPTFHEPGVSYTPPGPLPPPNRAGGYLLRTITDYFGRRSFPLGGITALAPPLMTVLNDKPGKGDPMASLRREEKMRLLQASLNQAQWAKLGGPQGLGLDDLDRTQRDLFLSVLPDPFRVQKVTLGKGGSHSFSGGPNEAVTLAPEQRARVRLRLKRTMDWYFTREGVENHFYGFGTPDARPEGTEVYTLVGGDDHRPRNDAFGIALKSEVPTRLKPSDLDFDAAALGASVALHDAPTVAELVRRVGQATGLDLYADPRVGRLPLWTRGGAQPVRSGDVLKALCLAVTGTFRRVGPAAGDVRPAFVLTDDLAGLGTRRARLAEWSQDAQAQRSATFEKLAERIRAQKPAQHIRFDENDPLVPGADLQARIDERARKQGYWGNLDTAVAELSPAAQSLIRDQLAQNANNFRDDVNGNAPFRSDRVGLNLRLSLSYFVPGAGEVDTRFGGGGSHEDISAIMPRPDIPPPPGGKPDDGAPVVLPPKIAGRALLVTLAKPEDAARAVAEAKRRGLNQLWAEVPETDAGKDLLAGAVRAGKAARLPVVAVVRLLRVPASASASATAQATDLNLLGESGSAYAARRAAAHAALAGTITYVPPPPEPGDWLRTDGPSSPDARKRLLLDLAATPGLNGLVLRDTAAPGYADPGLPGQQNQGYFYSPEAAAEFGYTPEMRLAFLRRESTDPVDLGGASWIGGANVTLPFFPDEMGGGQRFENGRWVTDTTRTVAQKWSGFRYETNARWMASLYAAIRAAHPNLPLLVRDRATFGPWGGFYGSWDKPDALPRAVFLSGQPHNHAQAARAHSRRVFSTHAPFPFTPPAAAKVAPPPNPNRDFAQFLKAVLEGEKNAWDGFVIDLSGKPLDEALPLLRELATTAPAATADASVGGQ